MSPSSCRAVVWSAALVAAGLMAAVSSASAQDAECGVSVPTRAATDQAEAVLEALYRHSYAERMTPNDRLTPSMAAAVERAGWSPDWLVQGLPPEQAARVKAIDLYGGNGWSIYLRVGVGADRHKVSYRLVCEGERWRIDDAGREGAGWLNPEPAWAKAASVRFSEDQRMGHGDRHEQIEGLIRQMAEQAQADGGVVQGWLGDGLQRQMRAEAALARGRVPDGWPGDALTGQGALHIEWIASAEGDRFGNGAYEIARVWREGQEDRPQRQVWGVDFGYWVLIDACLSPGAVSLAEALNTPRPGETYQWVEPAPSMTCPAQP